MVSAKSLLRLAIFFGLMTCSACGMGGDVRFVAAPVSTTASYQAQATQGQQLQTAPGHKAIVTVQSVRETEVTAPGYKAVIQPVIR